MRSAMLRWRRYGSLAGGLDNDVSPSSCSVGPARAEGAAVSQWALCTSLFLSRLM